MKKIKEFDFSRARKITPEETAMFRKAFENTFGFPPPPRGRPPKGVNKYKDVHIKLHPKVYFWAKQLGKKRGVGYQTVINETLLKQAGL